MRQYAAQKENAEYYTGPKEFWQQTYGRPMATIAFFRYVKGKKFAGFDCPVDEAAIFRKLEAAIFRKLGNHWHWFY